MKHTARMTGRIVFAARCVMPVLLLAVCSSCPRGPSFTVKIVNESTTKAASVVKIFDDSIGQPTSDDLLRGPNVRPGRTRTITIPLSETEGGNALLIEVVNVDNGQGGGTLTQGVLEFSEDINFVATIFDDHIELDEIS